MAVALIVAAGRGERLGSGRPKALLTLAGKPMLEWSLDAVRAVPAVQEIVVALPPGDEFDFGDREVKVVSGGDTRSQSVAAAFAAAGDGDPVVVHDAARPLATPRLFERVVEELQQSGADAVTAARPVADTVKEARERVVTRTLDRAGLWTVQTPQVFRREALHRALARVDLLERATDDAWLVEQQGGVVRVLDSEEHNFKVTTAADLQLVELLLASR
jgi:2-C-methyl-D-erythritol 4-phosphate cytidylyltransferase